MDNPGIKMLAVEQYQFLSGGGEMGALTRAKDWSKTSLGSPEYWPQSLRTTLSIILNSKFPMFLFWGKELICFYNDAYRPSLGKDGKHPSILGMTGEKAWTEIWSIIKPLIDQVLAGGEATWSEDQLIPIYRNGKIEDVYWTFSYSPVNDESGKPAGVFVTCSETTDKVITRKTLEESKNQLQFAIDAADLGTWDINPVTNTFTGNGRLKEWHGLFPDTAFDIEAGFERVIEKDRESLRKAIAGALEFSSGGILDHEYSIVNPTTKQLRVVRVKGKTTFGEDKMASRLNGTLQDVTEQVLSRKKVEESSQAIHNMVLQAPIGICVMDAETLISEIVNDSFIEVAGKPYEAIAGKYYWDTFAEARSYYEPALNKVVEEGVAFHANEVELMLIRHGKEEKIYVTFVYAPLKDTEGKVKKVAVWVLENTMQVTARQKIEEADRRFRNTIKQAPVGITILRGPQFIVEMANDAYLRLADKKETEFVGRPLFDSLPEVEETIHALLDNVLQTGVPFHGLDYPVPIDRYGKHELSYFDFLYYPLWEYDGKISGIIVTATDVTETVKSKHFIAESEARFRSLITQSPMAMVVFRGPEQIIEIANSAMLKRWNKTENELKNKKFIDVFPEIKDQKFPALLDQVYKTGKVYREIETASYIRDKDEKTASYVDFEYSPLRDADGKVTGVIATVNDVTEKVLARKRIEESEERYHHLIYSSPSAIGILYGEDLIITIANDAIIEIWGKGKEIMGKAYFEALPELAEQGYKEVFSQVYKTGIPFNAIETPVNILQNGKMELKYYNFLLYPQRNLNGEVDGIGIIATEVTSQALLNKQVQESEKRFRLLADSMPQHIWTADPEGNLNYFNQSVFDYSGLTPEQINKDGWLQIVHPDDREENIRQWINAVTTGKDFLFEHRFRRYDGEYRWQLGRAVPQKDADGKIQMWVGTSTDIQDIKELDQQKDYFISMASHELKTPITSIKGYAQMMQNMYLNSEDVFLKNSLQIIDKQIGKLTHLISGLLDVSKIKSGNLVFTKENFPVNKLIHEVIEQIKLINPDYDFIFLEGMETVVHADRERIGQVLTNLFTNAVKYSPSSRIIKVKSVINKDGVTISVEDSGIGITKKDQEKIFERFYRVEGKNERTFPGFGIGLFISAEIAQRHNGKINVESEPGKGSTFYFFLPFDKHNL
jgi:PAS domain S-box-containing protein